MNRSDAVKFFSEHAKWLSDSWGMSPEGREYKAKFDAAVTALNDAPEGEKWKAEAYRFAEALTDVMDGEQDHDIQAMTGLPDADCQRIAEARADAMRMLRPNGEVRGASRPAGEASASTVVLEGKEAR